MIDRSATGRIFMAKVRAKSGAGRRSEKDNDRRLGQRRVGPAKVIARRLCISEHTLRNRLTWIYRKLGVSSRLGLCAFAARHSLNQAP